MNFKSNFSPGTFARQTSVQSFTTDDKDIFIDKRSSLSDHGCDEWRDRRKQSGRTRSKSIGPSIAKWKTLVSLDATRQSDDFNLEADKHIENKKKSSSKFFTIDEEDLYIYEGLSPNSLDENMNAIFRSNERKKIICVNKQSKVIQRKKSYKMSRKLTRRMTTRQKQKLMMESEFDEFDDEEESKKDSLSGSEDLSDGSDDEDAEDELVIQLNMKRMQDDDSMDEICIDVEMSKVQRVADEFLATEKNYVDKLYLLDQIFQMNIILVNREQALFPKEIIPQMFSNIKSIYQFHHDFLLPKLQQVISPRSTDLKVGEVMVWFAPFLKLYIEYVKNFDTASDMINYWANKSPKFAHLLEELQKRPECGSLTLHHHMLEPIQRVPRYELLLKDYLKHLPRSSIDIPHTEKALKIVNEAAQFSNEAMRKIEKFRKLLDLNESLGEDLDLISPTREFIKEGKIMRVSAKDGSLIERYIILFNDLLLVCQSRTMKNFKIKSKMNIDDMEIADSHNLETPNCFYVRCREKSIELHVSSYEEKLEWEMAFKKVIGDYQTKLKSSRFRMTLMFPVMTDQLGKRAPTWVKDNETSMCMRCAVAFSTFRRRHHCRACGLVVCKTCSSFRSKLDFSHNREDRVCCFCYEVLTKSSLSEVNKSSKVTVDEASTGGTDKLKIAKMRLQVKAAAPSVFSGYMSISCDRKNWTRRWFAAHSNFILFSFKAHQDVMALTSMPLPGYEVKIADPCEVTQKENMFKVFHKGEKKIYYFQVEDINVFFKWIEVLQSLSKLIVPSVTPSSSTSPKTPLYSE